MRYLILKVNKNIAYAKIHKMISPSKDRQVPLCKYYDKCGGCSFWHINYDAECEIKRNLISKNLKKIGGLDIELKEFIPSCKFINYRNKAQFPVKINKEGR
jgi:23S rRNA (uracil1939-C5)-methyltransferase